MEKEVIILRKVVADVKDIVAGWARSIGDVVIHLVDLARAAATTLAGTTCDGVRPRSELIAENVLLRQQLIVNSRKIRRTPLGDGDRILLVLFARLDRTWRDALHLVKPETLLRWHRNLFRLVWRRKSRSGGPRLDLRQDLLRELDPGDDVGKRYKEKEDRLDAIFGAYLSALVPTGWVEMIGQPEDGGMVVPLPRLARLVYLHHQR
jgi:hypothetical protein